MSRTRNSYSRTLRRCGYFNQCERIHLQIESKMTAVKVPPIGRWKRGGSIYFANLLFGRILRAAKRAIGSESVAVMVIDEPEIDGCVGRDVVEGEPHIQWHAGLIGVHEVPDRNND